ncbi:Uncharacterized protein BM_BM17748 [Brugia malayi]|uniref:Uncharacterized protein n=1 Tax=Brugia malayi TaxID=6279 RepID=A0A4E9FQL4_BRUMA|nr:Uncharacterized protein BM_BM17748 [Brugia malayi]VIO97988.1 Uncharacterized protein BM_BM17748 [Brugia malayi]
MNAASAVVVGEVVVVKDVVVVAEAVALDVEAAEAVVVPVVEVLQIHYGVAGAAEDVVRVSEFDY